MPNILNLLCCQQSQLVTFEPYDGPCNDEHRQLRDFDKLRAPKLPQLKNEEDGDGQLMLEMLNDKIFRLADESNTQPEWQTRAVIRVGCVYLRSRCFRFDATPVTAQELESLMSAKDECQLPSRFRRLLQQEREKHEARGSRFRCAPLVLSNFYSERSCCSSHGVIDAWLDLNGFEVDSSVEVENAVTVTVKHDEGQYTLTYSCCDGDQLELAHIDVSSQPKLNLNLITGKYYGWKSGADFRIQFAVAETDLQAAERQRICQLEQLDVADLERHFLAFKDNSTTISVLRSDIADRVTFMRKKSCRLYRPQLQHQRWPMLIRVKSTIDFAKDNSQAGDQHEQHHQNLNFHEVDSHAGRVDFILEAELLNVKMADLKSNDFVTWLWQCVESVKDLTDTLLES